MRIGTLPAALAALVLLLVGATAFGAVTGIISGTVTDAKTGAALSGVNIRLAGADLTTVTDSAGRFVITNVPPGAYAVAADLVGYAKRELTDVVVVQDHEVAADLALIPTVLQPPSAEAVVVAPRVQLRPGQVASVYIVTDHDEQLSLSQPNDRYQFPGLVFTQPGVVPDSTFYPHIRGARETQVGYFMDGIPITEPNNNVFATNIVSVGLNKLELFTGGYDAQYGGFVGGIINEVVKSGDQVRGGFYDLSLGSPNDFSQGLFEAGGGDSNLDWYVSGNTWQTRYNGSQFVSEAPRVWDGIGKFSLKQGDDRYTLLSSHGYGRFFFPFEHTRTFDPSLGDFADVPRNQDFARQGYDLDAFTVNHTISPRSYWSLRAFHLNNWLRIDAASPVNLIWQDRAQNMRGAQFDYTNQLSFRHRLQGGVWYVTSDNHMRTALDLFIPPFGLLDQQADNDTRNLQAYLLDNLRLNSRLALNIGIRYDRMRYDRPAYGRLDLDTVSPRFGLTYELNPSLLLRANAGRYTQFPPAARTGVLFATGNPFDPFDPPSWYLVQQGRSQLLPQLDNALDLGFEAKLGRSTLATATYYRRESRQMLQRWAGPDTETFDLDYPYFFASNGHGVTRGVELKVQRRLSDKLEGWLSYTRQNAKATSPYDNTYPLGPSVGESPDALFPVDYDQRDTASLVLNYNAGKLSVNPWMTYGSGFPFALQSGLDLGGADFQHGPSPDYSRDDVPILINGQLQPLTAPNTLRTDANFVFSLNLKYRMREGRELYLDLYNLLNRRDVTSLAWYNPTTGAPVGYTDPTPLAANSGDEYYQYVPFTTTLPFFVAVGVRQAF